MKYLIEIHHGIGDIVQMTGVVETLYNTDSDARIDLILLNDSRKSLLKNDHRIKTIYTLDIKNQTWTCLMETIKIIRGCKYDYIFYSSISNVRDTNILALCLNAKKNVGEQFRFLSHLSSRFLHVKKEKTHIVKRNANLLLTAGLTEQVFPPKLIIKETIKVDSNRVIGLCIGTSKPQKTWAVENYIDVAKHFSSNGYDIVFIGGKVESEWISDEIFIKYPNWHNYMGKLSLTESAALVKSCNLVIGGDTGIMHIAAALNVATVAIFSCSDPGFHAPFSDKSYFLTASVPCQYCYETERLMKCQNYICLSSISVNQVTDLTTNVLKGTAGVIHKFFI